MNKIGQGLSQYIERAKIVITDAHIRQRFLTASAQFLSIVGTDPLPQTPEAEIWVDAQILARDLVAQAHREIFLPAQIAEDIVFMESLIKQYTQYQLIFSPDMRQKIVYRIKIRFPSTCEDILNTLQELIGVVLKEEHVPISTDIIHFYYVAAVQDLFSYFLRLINDRKTQIFRAHFLEILINLLLEWNDQEKLNRLEQALQQRYEDGENEDALLFFYGKTNRFGNGLVFFDEQIKKSTAEHTFVEVHWHLNAKRKILEKTGDKQEYGRINELLERNHAILEGKREHETLQKAHEAFERLIPFLLHIDEIVNKQVLVEGLNVIKDLKGDLAFVVADLKDAYVVPSVIRGDERRKQWLVQRRHELESRYGLGVFPVTIILPHYSKKITKRSFAKKVMGENTVGINIIPEACSQMPRIGPLFAAVGGLRFYDEEEATAHEDLHGQFALRKKIWHDFHALLDEMNAFRDNVEKKEKTYQEVLDSLQTFYLERYYAEEKKKWTAEVEMRIKYEIQVCWYVMNVLGVHFPQGKVSEILHETSGFSDLRTWATLSLDEFEKQGGFTQEEFEKQLLQKLAGRVNSYRQEWKVFNFLLGRYQVFYLGAKPVLPSQKRDEIHAVSQQVWVLRTFLSQFELWLLLQHSKDFKDFLIRAASFLQEESQKPWHQRAFRRAQRMRERIFEKIKEWLF